MKCFSEKEIALFGRRPLLKMNRCNVLLLAITVALFYLLPFLLTETSYKIDLSIRQILVFPVILYFFYRVKFADQRLPGVVLLLSLVAGISAAGFAYSYKGWGSDYFLIARFKNDPYEIESRKFRQRLSKRLLLESGVQAKRYFQPVVGRREARGVIESDPDLPALVWGGKRWLNIYFQGVKSVTLGKLGLGDGGDSFSRLRVIVSVPNTGLSYQPERETIEFLALVLSVVVSREANISASGKHLKPEEELSLVKAGKMRSPWVSQEHQAFSWWILGNWYLKSSIGNRNYAPGDLKCAVFAYETALSRLQKRANTELFSAIANNLAVAYYLRTVFERGHQVKRTDIKDLIEASAEPGGKSHSKRHAWDVAKRNEKRLYHFRKQKTGIKRKKASIK